MACNLATLRPNRSSQFTADRRTDVWCLAATIMHALTGNPPVQADSRYNGQWDAFGIRYRAPDGVITEEKKYARISRVKSTNISMCGASVTTGSRSDRSRLYGNLPMHRIVGMLWGRGPAIPAGELPQGVVELLTACLP
jgi:serine/threonine protein kinase